MGSRARSHEFSAATRSVAPDVIEWLLLEVTGTVNNRKLVYYEADCYFYR
jgi:hypothetical protein